jgi:DNA-directed RNA polymerase subunit N (RpoN/RPB10)
MAAAANAVVRRIDMTMGAICFLHLYLYWSTVLEDVMIDAIKMTQQLVALELVDEGVTAKHILDRLVKRRILEDVFVIRFCCNRWFLRSKPMPGDRQ